MSIQALVWALEDAPDVPSSLVTVLMGLANHADQDGKGAYPTVDRLAHYTRKSRRQIINDLTKLRELKLITPGDQRILAHIDSRYRPVVYDLAMNRRRPRYVRATSAPEQEPTTSATAPNQQPPTTTPHQEQRQKRKPSDAGECTPAESRGAADDVQGCSAAHPGVQPTAPKPSLEPKDLTPLPPVSSGSAVSAPPGEGERPTTDDPLITAAEAACRHQPRWLRASVLAAMNQAISQGLPETVTCEVIVDLAKGEKYGPTTAGPQRILARGPWWKPGEVFIPAPRPKQAFTPCPEHPSEPASTCRCCRGEKYGSEQGPGPIVFRTPTEPSAEAVQILASLGFRRKVGSPA